MSLVETEPEGAFRAQVREFLDREIPLEWRERGQLGGGIQDVALHRAWSRKLDEAGYAALTWPVKYGGGGKSIRHLNIYLEESAAADAPDHVNIVGIGFAGPTILAWGTDRQREQLIPPLLRGDQVWCQGFSEPEAGSDLASLRTSASRSGDTWVVQGHKIWSSFAHIADKCILLARTDPAAPKHAGLSMFLIDMDSPGIEVRPLRQVTGHSEFNEIFFDGVEVPASSMLGSPGDGWRVAMTTLRHERGTSAMGMAAGLAKQVHRFARTLLELELGSRPEAIDALALAWVRLQALRLTNERFLEATGSGQEPGPETSASKLMWSTANQDLTTAAHEVVLSLPVSDDVRRWQDYWLGERLRARGNSIEGGTSEILLNILGERVLGLPRSR